MPVRLFGTDAHPHADNDEHGDQDGDFHCDSNGHRNCDGYHYCHCNLHRYTNRDRNPNIDGYTCLYTDDYRHAYVYINA